MTDKEKILAEIERRKNIVNNAALQIKNVEKRNHYLGIVEEYDDILRFINSLPEEPVSEDNNLRKASEEYLKVLSKTPYNNTPITNAQTIVRELITFLDSPSKYNPNHIEEPVSEELDSFAKRQADEFAEREEEVGSYDRSYLSKGYYWGCKNGAQWQKEQFEKNRLKHCNSITNEQAELEQGFVDQHIDKYQRMPTFLDAIEYGMKLQKEQMMSKAIDAIVHTFDNGYIRVGTQLLANNKYGLKVGDKVKVIIIKDE